MTSADPHNLQRFVDAQRTIYEQVCRELARGRKTSHWMWFIFPQLRGLGTSATSQHFAIESLAEARAYLQQPLLGARLLECTQLVNAVNGRSAEQVFGYPDDMKFHSCMTLFVQAAPQHGAFTDALAKYFGGQLDRHTLDLLMSP